MYTPTTVKLAQFNNSWYQPGPGWKRGLWYLTNRLFYMSAIPWPSALKRVILRLFGAKVGKRVVIKPRVSIKYPWFLEIGADSWIGEGVWIDNLTLVSIGGNVCLSQDSLLLCGNHDYKKTSFDLLLGPITLEEGVWIGARAVVCPGVTCKTHSVLSVGSVAVNDLEAYGVYQGNPAAKVREREIGH